MTRSIHIRDVDDDVYDALKRRGAELGLSVPEYLLREAERLAARLTVEEWVERTRRRTGVTDRLDTLTALDESRGPRPA